MSTLVLSHHPSKTGPSLSSCLVPTVPPFDSLSGQWLSPSSSSGRKSWRPPKPPLSCVPDPLQHLNTCPCLQNASQTPISSHLCPASWPKPPASFPCTVRWPSYLEPCVYPPNKILVFALAPHILNFEQYRDWRGSCARMTQKFMKHSVFLLCMS